MIREKIMMKRRERRELEEKKSRKYFYFFVASAILFTFCLGAFIVYGFPGKKDLPKYVRKFTVTEEQKENSSPTILPTMDENMTVMLMGVDERHDDVGRSDTLMLLNVINDEVSLLSVPRDTRVYVERHGYQKINAAYAYGGEDLTKKTLEEFLGIEVNRHVKINTVEFVKLIDILGGVDVYIERDMDYEDPWDDNGGLSIHLTKGLQHLDGKKAIQFVRFRDEEGDAGRVRRQQTFMQACADRLTDPSMLLKLPEILGAVNSAVETDLSYSEMLALAGSLKSAESSAKVRRGTVPGYWEYIDGVSYLVPDVMRLGEVVIHNLGMKATQKHFEQVSREYPVGSPYNFYDVNPDQEKDFKVMDDIDREQIKLTENNI